MTLRALAPLAFAIAFAFALVAPSALAEGPHAGAAPTAAADASELGLPVAPVAAEGLFLLDRADEAQQSIVALAQLEQQGLVEMGSVSQRPLAPLPPALRYHDAHPACDVDGDGVTDLVSNTMDLARPPSTARATSEIRVYSGANGTLLWKASNRGYSGLGRVLDLNTDRAGQPLPVGGPNVRPTADVNGDGVCDVFAYGFYPAGVGLGALVASTSPSLLQVRVLSGVDGKVLWSKPFEGQRVTESEPFFGAQSSARIDGFPTGFLPIDTPAGPRIVVKTTDVSYTHAEDPLGFSRGINPLGLFRVPLFKTAARYDDVKIDEHVTLLDAKDGRTLWTHDILQAGDARYANVTWIGGAGDIGGDASPEIVLDQYQIANPRGSELNNVQTGDTLFRFGRGMHVLALSTEKGDPLWTTTVLDPAAAKPNLPVEENMETLVWTSSTIGPDVNGDGKADVVASYVTIEEALSRTIEGTFRTHFVALAGANGTKMWDVRQQGWGFTAPDGTTPQTARFLAYGMVDVPTLPRPGERFPPKFVRMGVLDGADGSTVWSYERAFAQNSYLTYNLALAQFQTALAPLDADHDGFRDLVTPAQYAPVTSRDQVLLATSSHSYQLKSGLDGATMQTFDAWGPTGRLVDCGGAADGASTNLTFVTGHARRLEVVRFDAATGAKSWRVPIWGDPAPHAAASGVDTLALSGACGASSDGRAFVVVNQALSSGARGSEIVPVLGAVAPSGSVLWLSPQLRGDPTVSESLLRASVAAVRDDAPSPSVWPPFAVGAALGIGAGVATVTLVRRAGGKLARVLAIGLVLVMVAPSVAALTLGTPAPAPEAAPAAGPEPQLAPAPGPAAAAPASALALDPGPSSSPAQSPPVVPDVPVTRLASALAALGPRATPAQATALVAAYMRSDDVTAANASRAFDANYSTTFTREGPDMDGDGVGDLVVDDYCNSFSACRPSFRFPDDAVNEFTASNCDATHHLFGVSSRARNVVWDVDLAVPQIWPGCGYSFVIGTTPLAENKTGVLVYRWSIQGLFGQFVVENELEMLDAATGKSLWTFAERGWAANDGGLATTSAQSLLVNPLLPDRGENGTILLQGVGFLVTQSGTTSLTGLIPANPTNYAVQGHDQYTPLEWAAALDASTGKVVWRHDTFRDATLVNVLPTIAAAPGYDSFAGQPVAAADYWGTPPVAHDVTGDGVPDLAYRVLEWAKSQTANVQGPYHYDSRAVILDGKTGATVQDRYVTRNMNVAYGRDPANPRGVLLGDGSPGPNYRLWFDTLGDVNGDGAADLLQHEVLVNPDYRHNMTIVSGKDGKTLWNYSRPRDYRTLVVGDANGDGAPDVLTFDWFSHEGGSTKTDDYDTPGALPLVLRSGADGSLLWSTTTYMAPIDASAQLAALLGNAPLDLDRDGVLDVPVDAPEYLVDQTVIHHVSVLSGKDQHALAKVETVGAFALLSGAGDVTRDGIVDYTMVSGDVNDLWLTLYDGATATPLWSHRALQLPVSSYTRAIPQIRILGLPDTNATSGAGHGVIAIDMQLLLRVSSFFTNIQIGTASFGSGTFGTDTTEPLLTTLDARRGDALWGLPDPTDALGVEGATPGTKMYDLVLEKANHQAKTALVEAVPYAVPGVAAVAVAYPATVGIGVGLVRFARRFEGVPDLV